MEIPEEYLSHVSEFTFPYLKTEGEYRFITVVQRGLQGNDSWAIFDSPYCYNHVIGVWGYESRPSERDDEWLAQNRLPLAETLPLAMVLCADKKAHALSRISKILDIRVKRAEETGDYRLEEYRRYLAEWRIERKTLEES